MSYRLVYNNLSNAAHNTMRPLKSKGVHCIKIRVISHTIGRFRLGLVDFLFGQTGAFLCFMRCCGIIHTEKLLPQVQYSSVLRQSVALQKYRPKERNNP